MQQTCMPMDGKTRDPNCKPFIFHQQSFIKMKHNSLVQSLCALALLALSFSACDKKDPWAGTFKGEEATFGFGKAYTYVTNDNDGNPLEVGIAMDEAAFNNFNDMSGDAEVSLDYPEQAGETPFKHQFMGYAAHGHEPVMVYGLPHFDLHFYTSTEAERIAISPFDTVKANLMPTVEHFPAAYFPAGLVPQMGVHWIDPTSPEFNGSVFNSTFIWGSFDNKVTFLEPMISQQFIKDTHDYETDIKQPAKYDQPGKYYPTKYGFKHDHDKGEYHFYLSNFVRR
jgi:hypothetical protein